MALFGAHYPVTQQYLEYSPANPTPDERHAGIDFGAPRGTVVRAVRSGEVLARGGMYGGVAIFDGTNTVIYLHLDAIPPDLPSRVESGFALGQVGDVGTEVAHLHIEVRRGQKVKAVGRTAATSTALVTLDPSRYLTGDRAFARYDQAIGLVLSSDRDLCLLIADVGRLREWGRMDRYRR